MSTKIQVCNRCVMDTTAKGIWFDQNGYCNFCNSLIASSIKSLEQNQFLYINNLDNLVKKIKCSGKRKQYDCIVGVSGGVDSSYVLVKAVELGLRPLAVHMDNGWNSELAQNNISNIVKKLNVDLYTHVIDWQEYKGLMQAFFDSDVIDIEILYDNAMLAVNYQQANKYGLKYILSGSNSASEGMQMPPNWNWFKMDKKNIYSIAGIFGNRPIETFPTIGILDYLYYRLLRKINWTSILDYMDYNKFQAMEILKSKFGFKPYPYKHYESIFTRFYQGYILPEKFGIDKRKIHFSSLIIANQYTREEAIKNLKDIPYNSIVELEEDKSYFLKKMNWTSVDLRNYLNRPRKEHDNYPSNASLWNSMLLFYHKFKSFLI